MSDQRTALVLGGGGITGIAWETGLVAGLADAGVHLSGADLVIGTSAGSVVAAQLTSGADPARPVRAPAGASVGGEGRPGQPGDAGQPQFGGAMLRSRGKDHSAGIGALALAAEKRA